MTAVGGEAGQIGGLVQRRYSGWKMPPSAVGKREPPMGLGQGAGFWKVNLEARFG